jgi:N12 class adenine-specific DNA methylase
MFLPKILIFFDHNGPQFQNLSNLKKFKIVNLFIKIHHFSPKIVIFRAFSALKCNLDFVSISTSKFRFRSFRFKRIITKYKYKNKPKPKPKPKPWA